MARSSFRGADLSGNFFGAAGFLAAAVAVSDSRRHASWRDLSEGTVETAAAVVHFFSIWYHPFLFPHVVLEIFYVLAQCCEGRGVGAVPSGRLRCLTFANNGNSPSEGSDKVELSLCRSPEGMGGAWEIMGGAWEVHGRCTGAWEVEGWPEVR